MGSFPPALPAEAVPTAAAGRPGRVPLRGRAQGLPVPAGSSRIWRVDPAAVGATGAADVVDAAGTSHDTGYTSIQDIAFDPNDGSLYVDELAEDGALAFEAGFPTGDFPPAVLLHVVGASRTELQRGFLSEPGSVVVAGDSSVHVTDGMYSNGRLLRVRTAASGSPT